MLHPFAKLPQMKASVRIGKDVSDLESHLPIFTFHILKLLISVALLGYVPKSLAKLIGKRVCKIK